MPMNSNNNSDSNNRKYYKVNRMKHYTAHGINAYISKTKEKEQG